MHLIPMLRLSYCLAVSVAVMLSIAASADADKSGASELTSNKIVYLGSLHSRMLTHPYYSLKIFMQAIEEYQPDIIVAEVRADFPGAVDACIDGGIEQGIVYAYAAEHKIPVKCVDWFTNDWLKRFKDFNAAPNKELNAKIEPIEQKFLEVCKTGTFADIQNSATEKIIEDMEATSAACGEKLNAERSKHICENTSNALKNIHGKRILVVYGLSHKPGFHHCLSNGDNKFLQLSDWYSDSKKQEAIPKQLILDSIKNIERSRDTLTARLNSNYYAEPQKSNLKLKLPSFDKWVEALKLVLNSPGN